jgi:hypothetical protein
MFAASVALQAALFTIDHIGEAVSGREQHRRGSIAARSDYIPAKPAVK